jgi:hypothetical protein
MNITNEQADYLLLLPKKIVDNEGKPLDWIVIDQKFPFYERFDLSSEKDDEFSFLWQIRQGSKNTLQISLHFQEDDSKTGLLRIDYNGGHTNPQIINEYVPERFHPYAGQQLMESHIHYYVQSYPPLAWAAPLAEDDFAVKEINENDFNATLVEVVKLFAKAVNIETVININALLL